jgi:hypothetical protein
MTYTDKKETMLRLKQWKQQHDDLTTIFEAMKPSLGCLANSPLFESAWRTFEAYTKTLVELLGATGWPDDWLTWYAYENNMGAKGMKAGYSGKLKPINNLADLCRLIEEGRKQP